LVITPKRSLGWSNNLNKDGRLIRPDYVFRKTAPAARSNIISLIKRLAFYSFLIPIYRSHLTGVLRGAPPAQTFCVSDLEEILEWTRRKIQPIYKLAANEIRAPLMTAVNY
jgi:hypothetical protein